MSEPRWVTTTADRVGITAGDPYGLAALLVHERLAWARQPTAVARLLWPWLLATWFAWNTWQRLSFFVDRTFPVGIDATIYYRGAQAWLRGEDPWSAGVQVLGSTYHYAGTPVTTLVYAPFTLLDERVFTVGAVALGLAAAVFIVWHLRLGLYWLLFPPLTEGLFSANPQILVFALLLLGWAPASALATMLKVYAFVPLFGERRWRQLALALAVNAVTFLVAFDLWRSWLGDSGVINGRLVNEAVGGFSAFGHWPLFAVLVVALALLALRDLRAVGWLAVPALWPATQFHYQTMAMPVMSPLLAVLLAYPTFILPAYAILADVGLRLAGPLISSRLSPGAAQAAHAPPRSG